MEVNSGVTQWQSGIETRDKQLERSPACCLFEAVTAVLSASLQMMIGNSRCFDQESYLLLREEFQKFYLWNEGFSTGSGDLDRILSSSKNLKSTVLSLMVSWTKAVLGIPKIMTNYDWSIMLLNFAELDELRQKVDQVARATMLDMKAQFSVAYSLTAEDAADSNSDGESTASDDTFEEVIEDLNAYMESLIDLSPSLNYPAKDNVINQNPIPDLANIPLEVSEPAHSFVLAKRKALLIGINYFGQRGQLKECISDAKKMSTYLNQNFSYRREDMVILTDDQQNSKSQPTKQNILRAMHWLVKDARPNDSLFFYYSGHGGQAKDLDSDEDDGYAEVIYPVDFREFGHIADDEMHRIIITPLIEGVHLTVIFDSCHSGTALDLPYIYSTPGIFKEPNLAKEAGQNLLNIIASSSQLDPGAVTSDTVSFPTKKTTTGDKESIKLSLATPEVLMVDPESGDNIY